MKNLFSICNYPSRHPLYPRYMQMLGRCHNPDHEYFYAYGGRGIAVCDRWRHDFWAYVEDVQIVCGQPWADRLTVDRVDNDDGYNPWNVRWADQSTQSKNQRHPKRGPMSDEKRELKRARIQETRARNADLNRDRMDAWRQSDEFAAWRLQLSAAQRARRERERSTKT